ncbi:MAG: phasin family protein [Candidatus Competibacteraceae bacterium]|nr:phasin family protein [Candidatus Competibacteraceae bacterium]
MTHPDDMFGTMIKQSQSFLDPVFKTNQLAVAKLEQLVSFQMDSLQTYVNLGLDRMKAAAEIDSLEAMQSFYQGQLETASTMRKMMMDDTKTLAEMMADFQSEFAQQFQANAQELTDKSAAVAKEGANQARKAADETAKEIKDTAAKAS